MKKWLLIFHVCLFENRLWIVSILTNRLKKCHWWEKRLGEDGCLYNRSTYFFWYTLNFSRYIGCIDIFSAIYLFRFAIPTSNQKNFILQGTYSWKMLWKCYYSMSAINISCYEELSMLSESVFLKYVMQWQNRCFFIEALVINFYKKMDCYQKRFHCYQSILGAETL